MVPTADRCTPLRSVDESQDNNENDAEYDEFLRFVYIDKLRDDTVTFPRKQYDESQDNNASDAEYDKFLRCIYGDIFKSRDEDEEKDEAYAPQIVITDPTTDTTTLQTTDAIKPRVDTDSAPDSTQKKIHNKEKEGKAVALPNEEQLVLVQTSWAKVVPIADVAADLFYDKLFELDPALRPLFPDKMVDQKSKLLKMLDIAVNGLTNLEELVPKVQNLGRRHAHYFDATPPMYATVGAALLDTLEKGLGDSWDEAHKEAWTVVYGVLSSTMIDAGERLSESSYSSLSIIREDIGIDTPPVRGDKKKMQRRISITEKYIRTKPPIDFRAEQLLKIKSLTAALFEDKTTTVNDEKKSKDENYWYGI